VIGSIALFYGLYSSARDAREKRGIIAMIPLFLGAIGFFGIFEQAPSTLSQFAEDLTRRDFLGLSIPSSYYQSVNGFFIVLLAPVFAFLWVRLAKVRKEPSSVSKFAIGMVVLAVAFVVMLPAIGASKTQPASAGFLISLYFFYTCAELCISPVGLSSMSKLAPKRLAGMVMGIWFLGTSIGVYLAGRATTISVQRGFAFLFIFLIVASLVMAAALFIVSPIIRKMMAADGDGPSDKSEKAEPEPLPSARVIDKD
jgi:proton-dependent oligopeptide transporter, POT family